MTTTRPSRIIIIMLITITIKDPFALTVMHCRQKTETWTSKPPLHAFKRNPCLSYCLLLGLGCVEVFLNSTISSLLLSYVFGAFHLCDKLRFRDIVIVRTLEPWTPDSFFQHFWTTIQLAFVGEVKALIFFTRHPITALAESGNKK